MQSSNKIPLGQIENIDKHTVGLGNVDNTSDADKPVSTATQSALDNKADKDGGNATGNLATTMANSHTHSNKSILDATTASYTTAEKNKLAGIEAGAEVNVNADWNATSGDAEILNKPNTFTPSSHTHPISDITGLQAELNTKLESADLDGFIYDVQYNSSTHTITFYQQNEPNLVVDLPIEQLIKGVQLVGNDLVFTFEDNTTVTVPLNTLLVGVVKSVNGLTPNSQGEIVLNVADIPNLSNALNNKLDIRMADLASDLTQSEKDAIYTKLDIINSIVPQAEAEAGTATTARNWTAQRVRQAILGWWNSITSAWGRGFVNSVDAAAGRTALGLENVDNTSDADKPISTATQTALNGKVESVTGTGVDNTDPINPVINIDKNTIGLGNVDNMKQINADAGGSTTQDPNNPSHPVILTEHSNSPGQGTHWYIQTMEHSSSGSKTQIARQYGFTGNDDATYTRRYYNYNNANHWTPWKRLVTDDDIPSSFVESVTGVGGVPVNNTDPRNPIIGLQDRLPITDTRTDNEDPLWYINNFPNTTTNEFKYTNSIGLNSIFPSGSFCNVETITQWYSGSGGYPFQIATNPADGKMAKRYGVSNTTWSPWVLIGNPYKSVQGFFTWSGGFTETYNDTGGTITFSKSGTYQWYDFIISGAIFPNNKTAVLTSSHPHAQGDTTLVVVGGSRQSDTTVRVTAMAFLITSGDISLANAINVGAVFHPTPIFVEIRIYP